MSFQIGNLCFADEAAWSAHWLATHQEVQVITGPDRSADPVLGEFTFACQWVGGAGDFGPGSATFDFYCRDEAAGVGYVATSLLKYPPPCTQLDADSVEASVAVFAAALVCLAAVWGAKRIYALLMYSRSD